MLCVQCLARCTRLSVVSVGMRVNLEVDAAGVVKEHFIESGHQALLSDSLDSCDFLQVRIEMFPNKRKYKTKVQHVDSPKFNECFKVSRIPPEDVEQMGCRIRYCLRLEKRNASIRS